MSATGQFIDELQDKVKAQAARIAELTALLTEAREIIGPQRAYEIDFVKNSVKSTPSISDRIDAALAKPTASGERGNNAD